MKQYILFMGYTYYAAPGWQGFFGDFMTITAAQAYALERMEEDGLDWWQVVDIKRGEIVAGEGYAETGLLGRFPAFVETNSKDN